MGSKGRVQQNGAILLAERCRLDQIRVQDQEEVN
jgi:hypothetical protein